MELDFLNVEIGKRKLGELVSPEYNPTEDIREDASTYEMLYDSIEKFGYKDLIIVNKRNNVIVSGNQRWKTMCDMVQENGKDINDVEVFVVLGDYDEAEEMAANSVHNNLKMPANEEKLARMMEEIQEKNAKMLAFTGLNMERIETMIADLNKVASEEGIATNKEEQKEKKGGNMFKVSLKLPSDYKEAYKDFVKVNTDAEIVSAVIRVIMGVNNGSNYKM